MKFGEHLTSHVTPEWRTQYVNYDEMKQQLLNFLSHAPKEGNLLPEVQNLEEGVDLTVQYRAAFEEEFSQYCATELVRVNTFFAEKLAEAQRKFIALKAELKAYMAHKDQFDPDNKKYSKIPWFADLVDKNARKHKGRFRKLHDLKLAFSEFYLSLILLQNFQNLNFTGFRKILKKHDKLLNTDKGSKWRENNVDKASFYINKDIGNIILETENLVTTELESGDRGKAMRRLRVPPLNEPASPSVFFLMGLFLGMFMVLLVVLILTGVFVGFPYNEYTKMNTTSNNTQTISFERERTDWRIAVRLYRGPFLIILSLFLMAFNVHGWRSAGVNHVLIFEIDPRNHLSQHHIMELAACMGVFWCISVLVFFYSDFLGISHYAIPVILASIMVAFFLNPLHILFYDARKWVVRTALRIISAPMFSVGFADFWLADQFTSLSPAFLDIEYFICFYAFEVPWLSGGIPSHSNKCMSNSNAIRPILAALPAWFRFAQCLRRYRDSKLAYPHLVNAAKYTTTFFVILFSALNSMHVEKYAEDLIAERPVFYIWIVSAIVSSCFSFWWDIRMDWGFSNGRARDHPLLRDSLVYSSVWYYYFAIIQDLILRFAWTVSISVDELGLLHHEILLSVLATAELFRRFVWNFFRLENEHLNNCGEFRAVRNISVSPATPANLKKAVDPSVLVRILPDEEDAGRSTRKAPHSIWKEASEDAMRRDEEHPANAELFPIALPDPTYDPDEDDDDKKNSDEDDKLDDGNKFDEEEEIVIHDNQATRDVLEVLG